MLLLNLKKKYFTVVFALVFVITIKVYFYNNRNEAITVFSEEEMAAVINNIFLVRNNAMLKGDTDTIKTLYDMNTRYGVWAYEHELKKSKYLKNWSDKQGVKFTDIQSKIIVTKIKDGGSWFSANLTVSTEYKYSYKDQDVFNSFRLGTYHVLSITSKNGDWVITKEWYTDPFADSLNLDVIKTEEIKNIILSDESREYIDMSERRMKAVEYADTYVGAAGDDKRGFNYNKKYINYNYLGGDCANFASQVLHEGGGFRKTNVWNYTREGSKAWVNAQAFKDYMVGSGRASLIAHGSYEQVLKASYKMQPGDFIAYEKKGKVVHVSVVTSADSKGYTLVNCHNTDRYRVPWDLGWSNRGIKFWLVRVHF